MLEQYLTSELGLCAPVTTVLLKLRWPGALGSCFKLLMMTAPLPPVVKISAIGFGNVLLPMPTSALPLEVVMFPDLFASSPPLQEWPAPATEPAR